MDLYKGAGKGQSLTCLAPTELKGHRQVVHICEGQEQAGFSLAEMGSSSISFYLNILCSSKCLILVPGISQLAGLLAFPG